MTIPVVDLQKTRRFQNSDALLVTGGRLDPTHALAAETGERPMVEYLHLARDYGMRVLSLDSLDCEDGAIRFVHRHIGHHWALAWLLRFRTNRSHPIVTTGEDIGFPVAILNGLTGGGKRTVAIIMHGSYLGSPKAALALRVFRGFSGVKFLCLSEALRRRVIDRYGFSPERVHNIGYGVDTRFFTPNYSDTSSNRLIMSAGMAMRDYKTLAAAASRLPDIAVRIAADSAWFRSDLDISGASLPSNVEARSYGDYIRLRDLYASAAFAVVPLYPAVHACGYAVIIEAMAMGKPVITTRIQGQSDLVIEGETGFYVSPGDPWELRDRIRYLMDRPAMIRDMGCRARELVEEKYTVEKFSARIAAAVDAPAATTGAAADD